MEHIVLEQFEYEIATRVASHALNGKRLVFWNISEKLWQYLRYAHLLNKFEYCIVTTNPQQIGNEWHSGDGTGTIVLQPTTTIPGFKPDNVIIGNRDANLDEFYNVLNNYKLQPIQIFMPELFWLEKHNSTYQKVQALVKKIPAEIPGGVHPRTLINLYDTMHYIALKGLTGGIANFGTYYGWSMYFIALLREEFSLQACEIIGFDTFQGFAKTNDPRDCYLAMNDRPVITNGGVDIPTIHRFLSPYTNWRLVEVNLATTPAQISDRSIVLAFVDTDDYSPTAGSLKKADDYMVEGGIILHDHYAPGSLGVNGECIGQRLAMDDYVHGSKHQWFNHFGTNIFYMT
jgi:hypothetical protein